MVIQAIIESPITENFLTDIKEQLRVEFENLLEVYQNMNFRKRNSKGNGIAIGPDKKTQQTNNLKELY
jgi:hypothetical protein